MADLTVFWANVSGWAKGTGVELLLLSGSAA